MPRWNSHVRLSPDSCVSHVIVRATEIYKKCMCQLPTFLGNFSSENLEFAITYFSYTKWMHRILELLLRSLTNLAECVDNRVACEIIESSARTF
jgi:hypothetical protein